MKHIADVDEAHVAVVQLVEPNRPDADAAPLPKFSPAKIRDPPKLGAALALITDDTAGADRGQNAGCRDGWCRIRQKRRAANASEDPSADSARSSLQRGGQGNRRM